MKQNPIDALLHHLQTKGKTHTWPELTKMYNPGMQPDWSRHAASRHGVEIPNQPQPKKEVDPVEQYEHQVRHKQHAKDRDHFIRQILKLKNEIEVYQDLKSYKPNMVNIPLPKKGNQGEATAIVQWSDWHVDEVVEKHIVNGLNQYNEHEAKHRCQTLFQNTIKLIETQRGAVDVPNLVLHLGGDFVGGYLHPELEQTNSMGPIEASMYALDLLISGIEYLLKFGKFKTIMVVTNRGNHGRLTKKMQFNNDHALNLETAIYTMLKKQFNGEKRLSWFISESELNYLDVYGQTLRFFHGHQVKYMGGIGGLTIPLYKAIHRWNSTKKAFYNFMCDKHTYSNPTPDCQVNGSLKGFDAFAHSFGFAFQPPLQSFSLLDSKRGITIKAPIFCQPLDDHGHCCDQCANGMECITK